MFVDLRSPCPPLKGGAGGVKLTPLVPLLKGGFFKIKKGFGLEARNP